MLLRHFSGLSVRARLFSSATAPMSILKKYEHFQQEFPGHVVLMQVGDFYEIYGDAVEPAAKILDIAVTRAPNKLSENEAVAMTGFPLRSFETFLAKLIRAGISVVVADQFAVPDSTRFDRKISRVITPGTLVEENLLEPDRNNFLLLLDTRQLACAWMDVSTGDFFTASCSNETEMLSLLARLKPREVLLEPIGSRNPNSLLTFLKKSSIPLSHVDKLSDDCSGDLINFKDAQFTPVERQVSEKLFQYVKEVLRSSTVNLKPLKRFAPAQHFMSIDADSFRSLDIFTNSNSNGNGNSNNFPNTLFDTMNECKTALGSRLLARRLQAPLLKPSAIEEALDRVEAFIGLGGKSLEALHRKLDEVGDIERILQRLCLRRPQGVARDLKSLAKSLLAAAEAYQMTGLQDTRQLLSSDLSSRLERIPAVIVDKPPLRDSEGGLFCPGFDAELDNLRRLRDDSAAVFSELATSYRQLTGVPNLRIVPFKGDQFVVEVSKSAHLPELFRPLMQTETRARYTTQELLTKSLLLRTISERVCERELHLLGSLLEPVLGMSEEIRRVAEETAHIDLESGFARLALRHGYTRPRLLEDYQAHFEIVDGRHPVLDKLFSLPVKEGEDEDDQLLRQFTPNSLHLTSENKFLLLTGPKMGGKSTFLRQNALIVLMAQCGSFVPARKCSFTPIDAIFTRIGASDDLSRDKSTFMLEMSETAHILKNATPRSLVLIDEIGRGTSASEGLALASAIARQLILSNRAWVLFATHYHEIVNSPLLASVPLQLARTQAQVLDDGTVLLLPKVSPGIAKHSYALPVASLAGIPAEVITAAQTLLNNNKQAT